MLIDLRHWYNMLVACSVSFETDFLSRIIRIDLSHTLSAASALKGKPKFTEDELPFLISNGSEPAFRQLYNTYFPRLYNFALRYVKSGELAEDIVQEIFIRIWENRQMLPQIRLLKNYLYTACKNTTLNTLYRAAREQKLREHIINAALAGSTDTENRVQDAEYESLLRQAIENLPPKRKRIFIMVKSDGKSYEQVSRELSISTGTVNDHIVKATRSVRAFLLRHGIRV